MRNNLARVLYDKLQDMLDDGSIKYLKRPGQLLGLTALDIAPIIVPRAVLEELSSALVVAMQPAMPMQLMAHHVHTMVEEEQSVDGFHPETLETLRRITLRGCFLKNRLF